MAEFLREPVRVVLTGPPGAGKSASTELLFRAGLPTMPEMARRLIREEQDRGGNVFPWTDLPAFVGRLWPEQERQFDTAGLSSGLVFFDRGIPDALAFLAYCGTAAPAAYVQACHRCRYSLVFDLDPLPIYTPDPQRPYGQAEALTLLRLNREAYRALGYEMVSIPVMPADARIELMLMKTMEWKERR